MFICWNKISILDIDLVVVVVVIIADIYTLIFIDHVAGIYICNLDLQSSIGSTK